MKPIYYLMAACALAIPASAQVVNTNVVAFPEGIHASAAVLTPPLVVTNDYLVLTGAQAELAAGGKAVFNFTIADAGSYVIQTVVNAPDESSNSFFVNIDAPPVDPDMIWDVEVTHGFEVRLVNWRGSGTDSSDEFVPKRFTLTTGAHQLIIVGREPGTELRSVSFHPAPPAPAAAKSP
jgi:hypothetical protein